LAKLKDVVELRTGPFGSSLHQSDYVYGGIPIVNPMHIEAGRIHPSQKHRVSEETAERLSEFRLSIGDVVLGRRGEVGRCAVVQANQVGWLCGTGSLIVRPRQGIASDFLQGLLSSDAVVKHLTAESVGTTMVNLNQRILLDLDIVVPPRKEQNRIVEKLEELLSDLDAGVAELKVAQRKLTQYRQSLLKAAVEGALTADWRAGHGKPQETGAELLQRILSERRARWEQKQLAKFREQGKTPPKGWRAKYPEPVAPSVTELPELPDGWVWASVDQCAIDEDGITDGPFGSNLKSEHYTESGPRVIRLQNIGDGRFQDARAYISEGRYESLQKHAVVEGDVVVAMLGEVLPRACTVPIDIAPAIVKADCARVRPNRELLPSEFLMAALNSDPTRKRVNRLVKGIGRPRVNLGNVRSILIPLPPRAEQHQILTVLSDALESCDNQNMAIERGFSLLGAQRKNLLKAAFAGRLVSQDPNDEPASELLARIRTERASNDSSAPRRRRKTA
jgi:type I restriction enzyme S subunit